jgi:serine protease AprX
MPICHTYSPAKTLLFILVAVLMASQLSAQQTYYIRFRDKDNNRYSVTKPEAFLSGRSIERRRAQHIAIRQDDLPLTDSYADTVATIAGHVVYTLKWDNAILVKSPDPAFASRIAHFPFIKSIQKISGEGPATVYKKLDAAATKTLITTALDTGFYGVAANQNTMIDINALHRMGYWGDGVLISVMDAGFQSVPANPYFAKLYEEHRVLYTHNYVFDTSYVYAYDSHGAETFSDIAADIPNQMVGTAPNAQFLLFITEDVRSERIIEEYNWAKAAETADSIGADVFSTSLGYTTFDAVDSMYNTTYATLDGHSTPIAIAANAAANKGILVINSAGNDGGAPWHYVSTPADADSVVAVGAVNFAGIIGYFSGRGPSSSGMIKPNVCAKGQAAAVVLTGGTTSTSNGTSFSCPIMAGAFACLREAFPSVPNMILINAVQQSGNYAANPNNDYGYGIPDFGAAYESLKALYPHDTIQTLAYPNPFSTSVRVRIAGQIRGPVAVELFDLSGRKLWTTSFPEDTYPYEILELTPPAHLASGTYILRMNNLYQVKLVKKP